MIRIVLALVVLALSSGPDNRIIYFYSDSCHYCPGQTRIIKEVERSGVKVRYVDANKEQELAKQWKVRGVPTTLVVTVTGDDAKEIHRYSGQTGKDRIMEGLKNNVKLDFYNGRAFTPFGPRPGPRPIDMPINGPLLFPPSRP